MTNWFKTLFTPIPSAHPSDPFAHPDIARMSHRDLADLPLTPPPAIAHPGKSGAQRARTRAILT